MVRFHWACDGGQNSFVPPGGVDLDSDDGVTHANIEMELSGQNETCPALITVPSNFLEEGSTREVGLVVAHGSSADEMRGPMLSQLAAHFARQGYVVMRYYCRQKEQRRQRIFERTVDTAAHSPYARTVKRWIFLGHGNGARIAALVAAKNPRLQRSAFVFLSYPLMDPAPPPPKQKAGAEPPADSIAPLMRLVEGCKVPIFFLNGELDYNCPGADLKAQGPQIEKAGVDARCVILDGLDADFKAPDAQKAEPVTITRVIDLVDKYIKAVESNTESSIDFPGLDKIVPSDRVPPRPPPEVEEPEEEPVPPTTVQAAPGIGQGMQPGGMQLPPGVPVTPASQQMFMLQQQMLMQRVGANPAALSAQQQQALQQHLQVQAMFQQQMQQQMAAAAAAGRPAMMVPPSNMQAMFLHQQQLQQQHQQQQHQQP